MRELLTWFGAAAMAFGIGWTVAGETNIFLGILVALAFAGFLIWILTAGDNE